MREGSRGRVSASQRENVTQAKAKRLAWRGEEAGAKAWDNGQAWGFSRMGVGAVCACVWIIVGHSCPVPGSPRASRTGGLGQ